MKRTDLRTREGRRAEIIAYIKEKGGFSIFWATSNDLRADVLTEMNKSGEVVITPRKFPWSDAKVKEGVK